MLCLNPPFPHRDQICSKATVLESMLRFHISCSCDALLYRRWCWELSKVRSRHTQGRSPPPNYWGKPFGRLSVLQSIWWSGVICWITQRKEKGKRPKKKFTKRTPIFITTGMWRPFTKPYPWLRGHGLFLYRQHTSRLLTHLKDFRL